MNGTASLPDIAAVTAHFNPCRYRSRLENYRRFRRRLGPVKLLTVECVFGGNNPELSGDDVLVVRGGDVMWQRERLLQIGIDRLLDQGYEKIVWLDADIEFQEQHWPELVSEALEKHTAVQCYSRCTRYFSDRAVKERSSAWNIANGHDIGVESSGLAWGYRASFLREVPVYQHCIVGSGDRAAIYAYTSAAGRAKNLPRRHGGKPFFAHQNRAFTDHYLAWAEECAGRLDRDIGYVDQALNAYSHGSFSLRDYGDRHRLLRDYAPETDIAAESGGPWRWTSSKPQMHAGISTYFRQRREDD